MPVPAVFASACLVVSLRCCQAVFFCAFGVPMRSVCRCDAPLPFGVPMRSVCRCVRCADAFGVPLRCVRCADAFGVCRCDAFGVPLRCAIASGVCRCVRCVPMPAVCAGSASVRNLGWSPVSYGTWAGVPFRWSGGRGKLRQRNEKRRIVVLCKPAALFLEE